MSQLVVQLSDRADALIAQLQKELFNRRRKKVSAAGVVESLVESAARSPNDKRFATAWNNLVSDIEKAAALAAAHGLKPANLSDAEWALVLQHRSRQETSRAPAAKAKARADQSKSTQGSLKSAALIEQPAVAAKVPTKPRKKAAAAAGGLTTRMAAGSQASPRQRAKAAAAKAPLASASVLSSNGLALASPL